MTPRTILVTGGTGLVGGSIAQSLQADNTILSLSRNGGENTRRSISAAAVLGTDHVGRAVALAGLEGIGHVRGDMTEPQFGLGDDEYATLAEQVDMVVHTAGVTDFTTNRRIQAKAHIEGTTNVVAFAERADVPLVHISTAYVNAEGTSVNGRWGNKVYIETKREAEGIVEGYDKLMAVIRPSIVWGNSGDGWTPSFQGLHAIVGMMLESDVPLLPFGRDTRVDFLPRDVVGPVAADVVRSGHRGEFWLTAGKRALTIGRIVELMSDFARDELGTTMARPRFVNNEMIDRLIRGAAPKAMVRRVDVLLALTSHFSSQPELPSSVPDDRIPDLEKALVRGARYWAQDKGLTTRKEVMA